jgi:hypothetical protein
LTHHKGTKGTKVTSTTDESVKSASQDFHIEIDQETKPILSQLEVGQKLGSMDW